jgi:hypothetical protein
MATFNIDNIELIRRGNNVTVRSIQQLDALDPDSSKAVRDSRVVSLRKGRKLTLSRFFQSQGFSDAIIDVEIDRTLEGASTLTVTAADPNGVIANLTEFQTQGSVYPTEIRLGEHYFALAGLSKGGDGTLTITFEDREVNALRRYTTPRKAKRSRITRAEFCRSLVQEATIITDRSGVGGRIDFISPESKMHQIIGIDGQTVAQALSQDTGFPSGIRLKYLRRTFTEVTKDKKLVGIRWKNEVRIANKTQLGYLDKTFKEASAQKASKAVYQAAALMAMAPGNLWNTNDTPGKPPGNLFSLPRKNPWVVSAGTDAQLTLKKLIPVVIRELKKKAKANPKWDGLRLASAVSGRSSNAMRPWWKYAQSAYKEWAVGVNRRTDAYEFTRGEPNGAKGESTWDALVRMASEVAWRCWCDQGTIYLVSDDYLIGRPSKMTWRSTTNGVNSIEWAQQGGVIDADCTVSVLSDVFDIDPGAAITIAGEGAADGKWIVKSVSQSLFESEASVTLTRPQPRLSEPRGEIGSLATGPLSNKVNNTVPPAIIRMIKRANKIDGGRYLMGGNGNGQYDCSAAVSQLLNAGGFLSGRVTTVQLNSFGTSGRGKYFTVYSEGGGGANGHTWLVFEKASGIEKTFEYHGPRGARGGWNGPPKRSGMGSKNVRHVKGL